MSFLIYALKKDLKSDKKIVKHINHYPNLLFTELGIVVLIYVLLTTVSTSETTHVIILVPFVLTKSNDPWRMGPLGIERGP